MLPTLTVESWLLYGAIFVFAALISAELYFRIRYRDLLWTQIYPQVYQPDEDLGYRYRPHADGEIRIPGIHRRFKINNKGFNGRDFIAEKAPGDFRIAFVGTSNTTGIWMNGGGKTFCEMLEEQLRAAGHRAEILNFGIDGRYRAVHEVRMIETDVIGYKPDLVLMDVDIPFLYGTFRRDIYKGYVMIYSCESNMSRQWCEAMIDDVRKQWFIAALYRMSYIVRAAVRHHMHSHNTLRASRLRILVEKRLQAGDVVVMPYSLKKSVLALQAAQQRLAAQGCELVIFQYFANPYYRQVTSKYGFPYIELDVAPLPHYVHDRDGHYRHQGHVEIARQLYGHLAQRITLGRVHAVPDRGADEAQTAMLSRA